MFPLRFLAVIIATLISPFLPETADEILARLGLGPAAAGDRLDAATQWGRIPVGNETTKGKPLFPRIDPPEAGDSA